MIQRYPQIDYENRVLAKVSDFGLSRIIDQEAVNFVYPLTDENSLSTESEFVGNRRYVAPEQIRKKTNIDKNTDIFAYGMTLCEMLTGDTPFLPVDLQEEKDYLKSYNLVKNKLIRLLTRTGRSQIDSRLIELLIKCLHCDPVLRWKEEKVTNTFNYFETIRNELIVLRETMFGLKEQIRLVMDDEYLFYQLRGIGLLA